MNPFNRKENKFVSNKISLTVPRTLGGYVRTRNYNFYSLASHSAYPLKKLARHFLQKDY